VAARRTAGAGGGTTPRWLRRYSIRRAALLTGFQPRVSAALARIAERRRVVDVGNRASRATIA
jgi:hypothetical protein